MVLISIFKNYVNVLVAHLADICILVICKLHYTRTITVICICEDCVNPCIIKLPRHEHTNLYCNYTFYDVFVK